MRRGEIRLLDLDLDPVRGGEANTRRPAIVVSNDRANAVAERVDRGVVTVVPLTSSTTKIFPFQVLVPADQAGLRVDSKAQAEQVRSVAAERLDPRSGGWWRRSWPRSTKPFGSTSTCSRPAGRMAQRHSPEVGSPGPHPDILWTDESVTDESVTDESVTEQSVTEELYERLETMPESIAKEILGLNAQDVSNLA